MIDYQQQAFEEVLQGYDAVPGSVRGDGLEKALRIVQPVIDRVFPFAEAKEALAYLAQGRARGKVLAQLR